MYYKKLDLIGWQTIFEELKPVYQDKIPIDAGTRAEKSYTMFTVDELRSSPSLVKFVEQLGLVEYWQPGPIYTLSPYSAIPIHLDYNWDPEWSKQLVIDAETAENYEKFEILKHTEVRRETILIPLYNCENSLSFFFEPKPGKNTTLKQTHQKLYYHVIDFKDCNVVETYTLDRPAIFSIDKLHAAVNFSNDLRITLDLRFLPCAEFDKLKENQ